MWQGISDDSNLPAFDKTTLQKSADELPGDLLPRDALMQFRKIIDNEQPRQFFRVYRMDGLADMRKDIMGIYKKPNIRLKACPRVRFEELGVDLSGSS